MLLTCLQAAILCYVVYASGQTQQPPTVSSNKSPLLTLSTVVAEGAFTELTHESFPSYGVRIKKTAFCDPTVNVYTGYLDVDYGAKHLFFYFFESRRDPTEDDVMMWINGGPGCSSSMGLLMELGPCQIDMEGVSPNGTTWNPYSWNAEANIFFLDQPVGVGFSYAEYGETVETTEDAARNVHAFITIFFETFAEFSGRPLHLAGESYAGKYLPVFASYIYDQNRIANAAGRDAINLQSVLIGNGITDISTLYPGRYEIECGTAALDVPFQTINTCVRMKMALPRCQQAMYDNCIDQFDAIGCNAAVNFCDSELSTGLRASGRNPYDISKPCEGTTGLCYAENTAIAALLNTPSVRTLLGATAPHDFTACSAAVSARFRARLDKWGPPAAEAHVAGLLARGVRVLLYAGTLDWQCNWVANRRWVDALAWPRAEEWARGEWREWAVAGRAAGETKTAGALTFATVRGAGHMMSVPHDKPAEAQAMVSRWLAQQGL
ncbi:peptidase S10 serine carboxypeptidase [Fomitopsis schrenkii]|uniref:Carboxypeptidase n=1 Tax=Fomitopsis schrenkii TaxID=2126942 RepID=S8E9W1_FOMSC|nr:peptidase S10 serine carboxypeptidase [Fomitopsis schrenkii]